MMIYWNLQPTIVILLGQSIQQLWSHKQILLYTEPKVRTKYAGLCLWNWSKLYGSTGNFQLNRCMRFLLDLQRLLSYRSTGSNTVTTEKNPRNRISVFVSQTLKTVDEGESWRLKPPLVPKWTLHIVADAQQQDNLVRFVSPCIMLYRLLC